MSHSPEAPEPFQFAKPVPPLTDNVHALLENCRRRAREHGVRQFTGNADGLFGNELAAALIADGKAVTPEINPHAYAEEMLKQYGHVLGGEIARGECLRRVFDTLRPHVEKDAVQRICWQFSQITHRYEAAKGAYMLPVPSESMLWKSELLSLTSQYGIRAIIHPEIHKENSLLARTLLHLRDFQPGRVEELQIQFPLT